MEQGRCWKGAPKGDCPPAPTDTYNSFQALVTARANSKHESRLKSQCPQAEGDSQGQPLHSAPQNLTGLPSAIAPAVTNRNLLTQSHPTALMRTISHTATTATASVQAHFQMLYMRVMCCSCTRLSAQELPATGDSGISAVFSFAAMLKTELQTRLRPPSDRHHMKVY